MRGILDVLKHRKRLWLSALILFYTALFVLALRVSELPISPFIYDIF